MFRSVLVFSMILTVGVLVPNQSRGDVKVNGMLTIEQTGGIAFHDGILNSALGITGPIGNQGIQGPQGPAGPAGNVTLASICAAITAENQTLPSFCNNYATLKSISVVPANSSSIVGNTTQFTANGIFSNDSVRDVTTSVTWSSSNSTVATISNTVGLKGKASSVALGTTIITATLGNLSGSASLNIFYLAN